MSEGQTVPAVIVVNVPPQLRSSGEACAEALLGSKTGQEVGVLFWELHSTLPRFLITFKTKEDRDSWQQTSLAFKKAKADLGVRLPPGGPIVYNTYRGTFEPEGWAAERNETLRRRTQLESGRIFGSRNRERISTVEADPGPGKSKSSDPPPVDETELDKGSVKNLCSDLDQLMRPMSDFGRSHSHGENQKKVIEILKCCTKSGAG